MGYSFESRVRFSEAGEDGRLTLPGILDYYQDCCTFQAASIQQGQKELAARDRVWVLSGWQVVIARYPEVGEPVIVTTYPYKLHGFIGLRNFTMETKEGERLSWANSYWTYLTLSAGTPAKLMPEDIAGYVLDEKLDMEYAPRKIALSENMTAYEPFEVQKHHLDANHHVNNCQYVRLAQDYLPEKYPVRQIRVEYKQQGRLGDIFYPTAAHEEDRELVVLADANSSPYSIIEFR